MELEPVYCRCGAVIGDQLRFHGVFRPICPGCKKRITLVGDGQTVRVTQVTAKPKRLPVAVMVI